MVLARLDQNDQSGESVTITGTSRTLTLSDNGRTLRFTSSSAITVTLPQDSTEDLPDMFNCDVIQEGTGQITFAVEGTDTLLSENSWTKTVRTGSAVAVIKFESGKWFIAGSITT
jgi:hypothetical protein